MYYLELNDASLFELTDIPKETTTKLKGVDLKALEMELQNVEIDLVRSSFSSEFNTRTVKVLSEKKIPMTVYDGYSILRSIATNEQDLIENPDSPKYTVVLAVTSDLSSLVPMLQERIAELENEIVSLTTEPDPSQMTLDELKVYLVSQSKANLNTFLENNPISSSCHGGVAALYTCTLEKQQLLNNAIALCEIHNKLGDDYTPSWNAHGQECTYDWTLNELIVLAIQIEAVVKPLISAQQSMEAKINVATTTEEAMAVNITFEGYTYEVPDVNLDDTTENDSVVEDTTTDETTTEDETETPVENETTEEESTEETPVE